MNRRKEQLVECLVSSVRNIVDKLDDYTFALLEELRLRVNRPLMASVNGQDRYINKDGTLSKVMQNTYICQQNDIADTLELMSENSVYAFLEEIKNGFITIKGGNRVGLCGRVVINNGVITNITDISCLNIRIAKQVIGAADSIISTLVDNGVVKNALIISPPKCGKTTMLRDVVRQLGSVYNIGIVDERGEIAACYKGIPQHNVGHKTDVLDLCPKHLGIVMMLRSMAPQIIVTDEIATKEDAHAIKEAINSGIGIIATAHGSSVDDVKNRLPIDLDMFDIKIVLSNKEGAGTIERVVYA